MPIPCSEDELRQALRAGPNENFRSVDVIAVVRAGQRRRRVRRLTIGLAVLGVIASIGLGTTTALNLRDARTVQPASPSNDQPLAAHERRAALVEWANCLRDAEIPGVTVAGPAPGTDRVGYTDSSGRPLPADYRDTNAEWGSATDLCAAKVPELLPELGQHWQILGSARSGPRADASASTGGDAVLECRAGESPTGTQGIRHTGPWVASPEQAGEHWLALQQDPLRFASVEREPGNDKLSSLLVRSQDGRVTAIVYLLTNSVEGWRLHGANVCS